MAEKDQRCVVCGDFAHFALRIERPDGSTAVDSFWLCGADCAYKLGRQQGAGRVGRTLLKAAERLIRRL